MSVVRGNSDHLGNELVDEGLAVSEDTTVGEGVSLLGTGTETLSG